MARDLHRDLQRAALGPATQVRLDETLRRYVLIVAARDGIKISAAIRQLLYQALDGEPALRAGQESDAASVPFRVIVDNADDDAIEDLAEQLGAARS